MSLAVKIAVLLLLILLNGILALSEMAIVSARKTRLQGMVEAGDERARVTLGLIDDPARFLAAIQIGITLIGIVSGVYGGSQISTELGVYLDQFKFIAPYGYPVALGVIVLATTYLSLIIGELVPKQIALTSPESYARLVATPMLRFMTIVMPFERLLSWSSKKLLALLKITPETEHTVTEDEIKIIIDQATEAGIVAESEQDMLEGVLYLGETRVRDLVTSRINVIMLDLREPDDRNWEKIIDSGHSHFPVFFEDSNQIDGIITTKTLMSHLARGHKIALRDAMTDALYVPENLPALNLLEKFKTSGKHVAIAVDEHGGFEGIVTLHDIFEAIVGHVPSGDTTTAPEARQREDGSWLVDGMMNLDDFKERFDIKKLPLEDSDDFVTLGGFVVTYMGCIPTAGDSFEWEGMRFEVVDMDRNRVDKVLFVRKKPSPGESV